MSATNLFLRYVIIPAIYLIRRIYMVSMFRGGKGGWNKNANVQREIYDVNLQAANGKVPPTWSPERSRHYTLRTFERDLILWSASSDVEPARQGPLVALRLGGSAKVLAREMDINILVNGMDIQNLLVQGGVQHLSGTEFILRQLKRRYAPLEEEVQISAISDMFHFKKHQGESTDECLARFDLTVAECQANGLVNLDEVLKAWMLMNVLQIPKNMWAMLLSPTLGALPTDAAQFAAFVAYLRRNGHLWEADRGITQHYFQGDSSYDTTSYDNSEQSTSYPMLEASPWINVSDDADDECSSGCSHDEEPVDFSAYASLDQATAGEQIYYEYRTAKRKFRKFTQRPGRGRKGKGKGKSSSKGKSKLSSFFGDEPPSAHSEWPSESEDMAWQQYAFQKGAGGASHGKGMRKGNPIGPDGKQMLCSLCKSTEHFQRFCPPKPSKQG